MKLRTISLVGICAAMIASVGIASAQTPAAQRERVKIMRTENRIQREKTHIRTALGNKNFGKAHRVEKKLAKNELKLRRERRALRNDR